MEIRQAMAEFDRELDRIDVEHCVKRLEVIRKMEKLQLECSHKRLCFGVCFDCGMRV